MKWTENKTYMYNEEKYGHMTIRYFCTGSNMIEIIVLVYVEGETSTTQMDHVYWKHRD